MNMHSDFALELHRQAVERRKRMALAACKGQPVPKRVQVTRPDGVVLTMTPEQAEKRRLAELAKREAAVAAREKAMLEALHLFSGNERKTPTARQIISEVSEQRGLSAHDVIGPWRRKDLVEARQEIVYRLRHETMMSFPQIGRALGGRDHTTAIHGYYRHAARLAALAAE